jgi:hypothetical protein
VPIRQESADDIRREMAEIRSQLHHDMTQVVDVASTVTDWRSYVAGRPWISLGVAFAAGYLVVPRRRPKPETTRVKLVPEGAKEESRKPSILMRLIGFAWPFALRAAQSMAIQRVEEFLSSRSADEARGGMGAAESDRDRAGPTGGGMWASTSRDDTGFYRPGNGPPGSRR